MGIDTDVELSTDIRVVVALGSVFFETGGRSPAPGEGV